MGGQPHTLLVEVSGSGQHQQWSLIADFIPPLYFSSNIPNFK